MARLIFLGSIVYLVVGFGQVVLGTVMEPMVAAYGVQYGDAGQTLLLAVMLLVVSAAKPKRNGPLYPLS